MIHKLQNYQIKKNQYVCMHTQWIFENFLGKNRGLQLVANKNLLYAQNELVGYYIGKKVRWHR